MTTIILIWVLCAVLFSCLVSAFIWIKNLKKELNHVNEQLKETSEKKVDFYLRILMLESRNSFLLRFASKEAKEEYRKNFKL